MVELKTKQKSEEEVLKPVSYAFMHENGKWCGSCIFFQPQTKEEVLAIHKSPPRNDLGMALPYQPIN